MYMHACREELKRLRSRTGFVTVKRSKGPDGRSKVAIFPDGPGGGSYRVCHQTAAARWAERICRRLHVILWASGWRLVTSDHILEIR